MRIPKVTALALMATGPLLMVGAIIHPHAAGRVPSPEVDEIPVHWSPPESRQ